MKYNVQIQRTVREFAIVVVDAENEAQARRKAIPEAKRENEEQLENGGIFCDSDIVGYRTKKVWSVE